MGINAPAQASSSIAAAAEGVTRDLGGIKLFSSFGWFRGDGAQVGRGIEHGYGCWPDCGTRKP